MNIDYIQEERLRIKGIIEGMKQRNWGVSEYYSGYNQALKDIISTLESNE